MGTANHQEMTGSKMSSLRRSRPDEQDASLRRLQEISITRHDIESGAKSPRTLSPKSPRGADTLHKTASPDLPKMTVADDQQKQEQYFFPPVLMVSDLPSSPAVHRFEKGLNPNASGIGGQISPTPLGASPASSPSQMSENYSPKHKSRSLSPVHGLPIARRQAASLSGNTGLLTVKTPPSPKSRTISETERKARHGSPLSSPSSPSLMLKHFKLFSSSGFDFTKRRGSEPILDSFGGSEFKKVQLGVTDRRWEKLRSILVAMKDEPVNTDAVLDTLSPDHLENLQDKISTQEELSCLHREINDLNVILRQKESNLLQLELEKNAAISYIENMKLSAPMQNEDKGITDSYIEQGIQGLRAETVTKEEVIEVTAHLLKEITSQKAYLERLLSMVVTNAPWLLDDIDRSHSASVEGDEEEDYAGSINNDTDDEVWC